MRTYISHTTALFFWRQKQLEGLSELSRSRKQIITDCCESFIESSERIPAAEYFGPGKKHVLVPNRKYRINPDDYAYHLWSKDLPPRAFIQIDKQYFISTPEFCFFQLAEILSLEGLVLLGLELCGSYRLQFGENAESERIALTTPLKLKNFVESCRGYRGYKKTARALKWILAGSASPQESTLYLRFCLPQLLRGYAFPAPKPNGEMKLNKRQQELAERSTSYGDLYWQEQDVDVEYFGEDYHTGKEQMNSDAKRNNALTSRNTSFYTITWDIYDDIEKFDAIAHEVARALGVRIRNNDGDLALRNWELSKDLKRQQLLTHPKLDDKTESTQL